MIPNLAFDLIARNMTGKAFDSLAGDVAKVQSRFANLGTQLAGIGQRMSRLGAGLSVAVTGPLVAIGKGFVEAASDAQEAASAFDALFKDQAGATRKWADETAAAMGRSTYELQNQAAAFQQLFSKAAPTGEAAAGLSTQFAALAQDLASFYNVSESDALEKLKSGLAGQSEPMRAFGVFLTEGAVKTKALEMGLGGVNGALTEQDKILARAALMLQETTIAQGDAERTSGSFANQSRALSAAWNDLSVKLGTVLLPLVTKAVTVLTSMAQGFANLSPATQEWIVIGGGLAAAIGPLLLALGTMATGVKALSPLFGVLKIAVGALLTPVGLVVAAFAGIVAAWVYWDEIKAAFPGFAAVVETAIEAVKVVLTGFWNHLKNLGAIIGNLIRGDFTGAWTAFKDMLTNIGETVRNVFEVLFPGAFDVAMAKVTEIGAAMVAMKDMAIKAVMDLVNGVTEWISNKLNAVWDSTIGKISSVGDAFYSMYDKVVGHSYVPDMVEGIGTWMAKLDGVMVKPAIDAANQTGEAFRETGNDMASMFEGFGSGIAEAIKSTKSWKDVMADALSSIGKMLLQNLNFGGGIFGGILKGLFGGLTNFASGGSFTVGGSGGIDSQLVAFNASPNERVSVTKPGQEMGGAGRAVAITINVNGAAGNEEVVRLVRQGISQAVPSIVGTAVEAVGQRNAYAPGYMLGAA